MTKTELMTTEPPKRGQSSGAMVEVLGGRHMQEVQAAMTVAKRFPRDETAAIVRIEQACKRTALAEVAMYSYPKGGQKIIGPSIRLAEVLAQCWGNLDFGVLELEQRNGESDWMSFCWDLETNTRSSKIFTLKHQIHKKEGQVKTLTDPRDIYELGANYAARRLRSCIMAIIPGDVQDLAVAQCAKTLAGSSSEPLIDRIRKMVLAFTEIGVSQVMLEGRLGHNISACVEQDLPKLRSIYQSIRDGMSNREDWFAVPTIKTASDLDALADRMMKSPAEPAYDPPMPAEQGEVQSQVAPEAEVNEGVDEPTPEPEEQAPPEPKPEEAERFWRGQLSQAKTLVDYNRIDEGLGADMFVSEDGKQRLRALIQHGREAIERGRPKTVARKARTF